MPPLTLPITVKQGLAAGLPALSPGEWGYTTDTHRMHYGTSGGNAEVATAADLAGAGDVVGPASATDLHLVRFDGATGKLLQDSAVTLFDDGTVMQTVTTAATAAVDNVYNLVVNSTGTVADGFGGSFVWQLGTTTTGGVLAGEIQCYWATAAHATRKGRLTLGAYDGATRREALAVGVNGSAATVGFLGAAPVARQTGDVGAGLVNLGLFSGTPTITAATLPGGDWVTATYGQTVGSTFAITGSSGTYQATGISVTLPAAGTYQIIGQVRGELQQAAAGNHFVQVKLRNTSDSADVANSETMLVATNTNGLLLNTTCSVSAQITVASSKTIELYAARGGTSWTSSQILSDTNGRTKLAYVKIDD